MIEFYFIRHAESKDNLRGIWAGWKDSPLSNHGMRQAEALAASLSHIRFAAIYTSDLKRALYTAKVLHSALSRDVHPTTSQIPLQITPALREQNFGVGEGRKVVKADQSSSLKAHYAKGLFPILYGRSEKFPSGESLEDVRTRAERFVEDVLTTLVKGHQSDLTHTVGVVSHGIFIGELVAALMKKGGAQIETKSLRGMKNTAWTKVEVRFHIMEPAKNAEIDLPNAHTLAQTSDAVSTGPIELAFTAKVVAINRNTHLSNLHRQKGGIGNMAYDPKQQDIRKFLQAKPRPGSEKKTVKDKEKSK